MVPAAELRAELADVHDIDQAVTALIRDGLATRLGELVGRQLGRRQHASPAR